MTRATRRTRTTLGCGVDVVEIDRFGAALKRGGAVKLIPLDTEFASFKEILPDSTVMTPDQVML